MALSVPLTQGFVAQVDEQDAHVLCHKWTAHRSGPGLRYVYAVRMIFDAAAPRRQRRVYLHRELLAAGAELVDHKNGNTLDCRRANLRLASKQQNNSNCALRVDSTSGFKGVRYTKHGNRKKRWEAVVGGVDGKQKHLGRFLTPEEAARAYDAAAAVLFGEFARLNFA